MITAAWRAGDDAGRPGWKLKFGGPGWSQDKLDSLKGAVPYAYRDYSNDDHEWWVSTVYEGELLRIFGGEFEPYLRQLPLL